MTPEERIWLLAARGNIMSSTSTAWSAGLPKRSAPPSRRHRIQPELVLTSGIEPESPGSQPSTLPLSYVSKRKMFVSAPDLFLENLDTREYFAEKAASNECERLNCRHADIPGDKLPVDIAAIDATP
jgi:hypothetical protein